jgi:hypothetical protein
MPTSFVVKLLLLAALLGAFYMATIGKLSENLGEYAIWWQGGIGILLLWSIYETFNHFKKKEKNKYRYMIPLPDSEYCAICDGELETTEKGKLQCKDCKCFAQGVTADDFRDTEVIEEKTIMQLAAELEEADTELKTMEMLAQATPNQSK